MPAIDIIYYRRIYTEWSN